MLPLDFGFVRLYLRGIDMRKIVYFITGILVVPAVFGMATSYFFGSDDYETFVGFWGSVYLLVYLLFPLIYRGKIAQKIFNRYMMYAILYAIAGILLLLLF